MTRPTYETGSDRANEGDAITELADAWKCRFIKLPRMYPMDFALIGRGNRARCLVEVKCRTYTRGAFPTYHLSAKKVADMAALSQITGLPAVLLVRLKNALLWHRIDPPYDLEVGGRRDRGDWQDVEPVCAIPFDQFEEIEHAEA